MRCHWRWRLVAFLCALAVTPDTGASSDVREIDSLVFISIGSDDWGRWSNHGPLWPDLETRAWFENEGLVLTGGTPATVETQEDLRELWEFLHELNEGESPQKSVVLTPFWISAGPDFEAMRDAGCLERPADCEYKELWWHNSSGGLDRPPFLRGDLRELYKEGFRRGLWHPEYHGRSHMDTNAWTAYIADGDPITTTYFAYGLTYYHYGRANESSGLFHSTHSEYLSDDRTFQKNAESLRAWTGAGLDSFKRFWG